jgi:hypothetical protein
MIIIGDATTWSITYGHHSDDFRGVIYYCNFYRFAKIIIALSKISSKHVS